MQLQCGPHVSCGFCGEIADALHVCLKGWSSHSVKLVLNDHSTLSVSTAAYLPSISRNHTCTITGDSTQAHEQRYETFS